jgi:hypothetical protein
LSERQQDLAQKAEQLEQKVDDMAEQAEDSEAAEQMQAMQQQFSEDKGPQENMREASKELQQQQQQSAMAQQQEAMQKLITLFQMAQQAQSAMESGQMQQMAANFQKYAKRTLELSHKQEALSLVVGERKRPDQEKFGTQDVAKDQMSYLRATERVADEIMKMAGMSLQVPPALIEALGRTLEHMQNSVLFLEQNKSFMSSAYATNAVQSLNEATIEMLRGAKQCSSGSPSGSGGQSAMQMLQQMIPQQQSVMEQTRSMMEMQALEEMMRQERQAQLERLAGEQRSLKESAEKIQEQVRDKPNNSLGRLDRTIEDMEAVVKALEQGALDENLVNKEQRILSRLLDAQRSVHTRDYEKKRQSATADDVYSKSLGPANKEPISQSLREEIRRAMQLKAPGEFEDLIKLYFRALAEESLAAPDSKAKEN